MKGRKQWKDLLNMGSFHIVYNMFMVVSLNFHLFSSPALVHDASCALWDHIDGMQEIGRTPVFQNWSYCVSSFSCSASLLGWSDHTNNETKFWRRRGKIRPLCAGFSCLHFASSNDVASFRTVVLRLPRSYTKFSNILLDWQGNTSYRNFSKYIIIK